MLARTLLFARACRALERVVGHGRDRQVNAAQRNRQAAMLRSTGYEDSPPLTLQSTEGDIPHGRELSFAWLSGTVLTGLTSVLLMGAALYVSFQGRDTFSTPYAALAVAAPESLRSTDIAVKTDRVRPIQRTKSDLEIIEASVRENVDGRVMIRNQPFVRLRATLATSATALADDVPAYDPVALVAQTEPVAASESSAATINTDVYGAEVEGEVAVRVAALPATLVPARAISDQAAAAFVLTSVEGSYAEMDPGTLAYAPADGGVRTLSAGAVEIGDAENLTVLAKPDVEAGLGRSERVVTVHGETPLSDILLKNGFTVASARMVMASLGSLLPSRAMPDGAKVRILFGSRGTDSTLVPYRASIYFRGTTPGDYAYRGTVALTDRDTYVVAVEPGKIDLSADDDVETADVSSLPSIYRAIWETARKHDLPDETTRRIVAMYAYDIDLTRKVGREDSIEILRTPPAADGKQELLYVALNLGSTKKELFRFAGEDGAISFYDPDGETGRRFLNRRPLQGGGNLRSRFGYRVHPIFKTRKLHTGVDLAAKTGTPIYAAGDGVIEKAGWSSGYGRYTVIRHVNGFETGYGHQTRFAEGIKAGVRVKQGQLIGYVGSTGNSTGPHLHFEIKVNGRFVDPLSVKLPRDKSLSAQYDGAFKQTIAQIRDLMERDAKPMTVASAD
jgi:murein DD-endopeptidase MepM/ murein hydrolase activator NlpD